MNFTNLKQVKICVVTLVISVLIAGVFIPDSQAKKKKKIALENVESIAILPFAYTYQPEIKVKSGDVSAECMIVSMKKKSKFSIIPFEEIEKVMTTEKIKPGTKWVIEKALVLGKAVNADVILVGVADYSETEKQREDGLNNLQNIREVTVVYKIKILNTADGTELGMLEFEEYRYDARNDPMQPVSLKELLERCAKSAGKKMSKQLVKK